ncbi:MAG: bifunctional phosphopantothenoylcysteine decarboxylase/phosphopantothenate--cysteine ligase CoaBC [Cyanobacteria bacterium Co-bin8]|nr:bifunctional phosphopantothenoylcysteine decarboxylase/phosphopantothenate--cysteine ligase CoaBC [Cyanobacteria bacterium Co-bin8]
MSQKQRVLIGMGGGIAAYKVCDAISALAKSGTEVRVLLTERAQQFVTPLTVATLARHPAYTDADFWNASQGRPLHIELGEWADVFLIAPLTANTLAKLAHGFADNLLTNTVLASTCPILLAPAMNTDMWQQPTVQENWQRILTFSRYHSVGPGEGVLACDRIGTGRMAEPADILAHLKSLLHTGGNRDLAGQTVLISSGSTREHLDPVRFIGNPSTGKMGLALAQAALHRGAQVTLVHGPMEETLRSRLLGIQAIPVTTAAQMQQAMLSALPQADWIFMAAAVADVKPAVQAETKLAKQDLPESLPLEQVPDIVATLAQRRTPQQHLIGFAAQTGDIIPPALDKLKRKGLDAIVANPVDQPGSGFGTDTNQAVVLQKGGREDAIAPCSKLEMAHRILDILLSKPYRLLQ